MLRNPLSRWGLPNKEILLLLVMASGAAWIFFWTATLGGAACFSRRADGYYNLQAAGFLSGHLNAAIDPHPGLLALADPYDPVANAPYRVHDMTYWKGKYYLYFGPAPTLLAIIPCKLLSGYFPSEQVVVAFFCTLGFLFAGVLLYELRRAYFQRVGLVIYGLALACVGIGSPTLLLNLHPQFYQVPIACAYALTMLGLWAISRVFDPERMPERWLLVASSCFGLCLASRPNTVLGACVLIVPTIWTWLNRSKDKSTRELARWLIFGFGPITAVGFLLLVYNWMRFQNPFEFGMRYALAGSSFLDYTPLGLKNLLPHGQEYVWGEGWWLPLFPFFESPTDEPYGAVRYLPVIWLSLVTLWPLRRFAEIASSGRAAMALILGLYGLANLVMISLFFFQPQQRYVCDFVPTLILLGVMGAFTVVQNWRSPIVPLIGVSAFALISICVNGAVYVNGLPVGRGPTRWGAWLNYPASWAEEKVGYVYGPIKLTVELPKRNETQQPEVILQTGYAQERRDSLSIHYLSDKVIRVGFFHAGIEEFLSGPVSVPDNQQLTIEAQTGALLPPPNHFQFSDWNSNDIAAARRKLEIKVNDQTVLAGALDCYPSRPWDLRVAEAGFSGEATERSFSGKVNKVQRLPLKRDEEVNKILASVTKPLALQVYFPLLGGSFEPLVATGHGKDGDLLYLIYGPDHTVRFAIDHPGSSGAQSEPVVYHPNRLEAIKVWLGSWASPLDSTASSRLYVQFNDKVVLDVPQKFGVGNPTYIGTNSLGFGSAGEAFSGLVTKVEETNIPTTAARPKAKGSFGRVDLRVQFPKSTLGQSEPLVVTGRPEMADQLYVRYLDASNIVLGVDHWGVGSVESGPLTVRYEDDQNFEITLGSLYPPDDTSGWQKIARVTLNGKVVLDMKMDFYPAHSDEIYIGDNPLGGSSCGRKFTGKIISIERRGRP